MNKHICKTCVYERDSSPSQHCDCCVDGDNWRASEPTSCPCKAYEGLVKALEFYANEYHYTPAGVIGETHKDGIYDKYIEDRGRQAKQALAEAKNAN